MECLATLHSTGLGRDALPVVADNLQDDPWEAPQRADDQSREASRRRKGGR